VFREVSQSLTQLGVDSEDTFNTFLGAFTKLRKTTISFVTSVCHLPVRTPARNNSAPIERIFMEFDI